jgi:hypothetical protein
MTPDGSPPMGLPRDTEELAWPEGELAHALSRLTAVTAARLHLRHPPLGEDRPVSAAVAVIAAAIGSRGMEPLAEYILQVVPVRTHSTELIARHGLVDPAIAFMPPTLAIQCVLLSPLSALLHHPMAGQETQALAVADRLLEHPDGRRLLVREFAQPTPISATRHWRAQVLERLRLDPHAGSELVLDVYEAAIAFHAKEWLAQIAKAREGLTVENETVQEDSLATANWWGPLHALERIAPNSLRERRYLGYEYRQGVNLFAMKQRLTGVAR